MILHSLQNDGMMRWGPKFKFHVSRKMRFSLIKSHKSAKNWFLFMEYRTFIYLNIVGKLSFSTVDVIMRWWYGGQNLNSMWTERWNSRKIKSHKIAKNWFKIKVSHYWTFLESMILHSWWRNGMMRWGLKPKFDVSKKMRFSLIKSQKIAKNGFFIRGISNFYINEQSLKVMVLESWCRNGMMRVWGDVWGSKPKFHVSRKMRFSLMKSYKIAKNWFLLRGIST